MPLEGFVYDPEADRYFWVGGSGGRHSGRDAQQQKVLDKKRRREEKKRQEKRRETEARRKEIQNRSRREEHGAGHDAGRGDAGGREGRRRGNVSLPALLLSRECGFCPCPGSVARYYECSSNLRLDEVRKARIQRSPKVHFNAVLNASHGFLWSRGASNRVFDDRLVVTNFASAASQAYPTKVSFLFFLFLSVCLSLSLSLCLSLPNTSFHLFSLLLLLLLHIFTSSESCHLDALHGKPMFLWFHGLWSGAWQSHCIAVNCLSAGCDSEVQCCQGDTLERPVLGLRAVPFRRRE